MAAPSSSRASRPCRRSTVMPSASSIPIANRRTGTSQAKARHGMKLTHRFAQLTPEKRPQDPKMDGTGLRFETLEHGGEYPDTMPQAIKLVDAEGRSCIYVPITQDGKVVDSQGFIIDLEDEW